MQDLGSTAVAANGTPLDSARRNHDWIRRAPARDGVERIEAFFQHNGYALHRHDTYAIGCTLAGVQSFHYRRSVRNSLPGGTMVLHPDEAHDGQAGTAEGFRYRMIYVEPALFQAALGGKPLPFIEGGLSDDPRLAAATQALLQGIDRAMDPLEQDDALFDLAHALDAVSGARPLRASADFRAAQLARDYLHTALERPVTLDELAAASGRDRWSLSRDFRAFFGTSPHRYLTMRRLDAARQSMLGGMALVDAAATAGFADQSHMTRHFVSAYGVTPSRWVRMINAQTR
ncbi:AraC family transcriptional regulator [Paraburkholderia caribensis]|uniref:AraC family transcriptional regulator n=1 Tax=Paraburkholderia caribensis TaxID=75105 RepID=A0A9Q6RY55_9BURK|nr:AraC family transcriptional regulator [Paraburkholderia caribensis]MCO4877898.1 AraC family transcriptional regulator [Paraburkholderia caribensis]PTB30180.1 AraC family transcriptional regulator [Paraburkholderia caribensis]QLB61272.1 AraC family transcriptional regulator [Paraburkholderia caribensis]